MMKSLNKSVRTGWLIPTVILVLGIGFTATSILGYQSTREYVHQSEITRTLPLVSDNIYSAIKKDLIDPLNVSSLMANDTFLINWVVDGEKDVEAVRLYLRNIRDQYGYISAFFVSEQTGNYYYYDGILKQISPDDDHDVWYYNFRELDKPVDLDVDNDEARQGSLTIFINHRLEASDGTFLGVTGVGLELTDIGKKFNEYREQFGHEIFFVDGRGVVQIHVDTDLVQSLNISDMEGIGELSDTLLNAGEGVNVFEYDTSEGLYVASSRYFPEFGWYLIVVKNEETSLAGAKMVLWRNILIGASATLVLSILLTWIIRRHNHRLEQLAMTDSLTSLYNRRAFSEMLSREVEIAQRYQRPLSLLMLDVDNFKAVNDRHGHMVGDRVLKRIAAEIRASIRSSDLAGRWGGDEFIVLLLEANEPEALKTAERILHAIQEIRIPHDEEEISVSATIGTASIIDQEVQEDDMIKWADDALLAAKGSGKGRIQSAAEF